MSLRSRILFNLTAAILLLVHALLQTANIDLRLARLALLLLAFFFLSEALSLEPFFLLLALDCSAPMYFGSVGLLRAHLVGQLLAALSVLPGLLQDGVSVGCQFG